MLTFEGGPIQGTQNIMQKLQVSPTFELPTCALGKSQVTDALFRWSDCKADGLSTLMFLQSLGTIAHQPARMDVQPSLDSNNIVIFVVGQIKVHLSCALRLPASWRYTVLPMFTLQRCQSQVVPRCMPMY